MYKPRSRKLDLMTKRSLWGWLFVLPFIVGFLVFIMSPLYTSLMMSFKESTSVSVGAIQESDGMIANSTIVTRTALVDRGLANYRRAFMQDTSYITALKNVATGRIILYSRDSYLQLHYCQRAESAVCRTRSGQSDILYAGSYFYGRDLFHAGE